MHVSRQRERVIMDDNDMPREEVVQAYLARFDSDMPMFPMFDS